MILPCVLPRPTRIDSPPEQVFDTLADVRNDARWNSRVSSADLRSPEPIGLGSQFAMVNGGSPYDVTITTHDRPSRLVIEAHGKPDLTIAYTVTPVDGGTGPPQRLRLPPDGCSEAAVRARWAADPPGDTQTVRRAEVVLRLLICRRAGFCGVRVCRCADHRSRPPRWCASLARDRRRSASTKGGAVGPLAKIRIFNQSAVG